MTPEALLRAYEVCRERGHTPSGQVLTSNPPWNVCKFCGTHFRYEQRLIESNTPEDAP